MKIKNIIIIWLVVFALASCVPAHTKILPTKTFSPSATSTYTAPSATLQPTEISATSTETPIPPLVAPLGFEALTENPHYGIQYEDGRDHRTQWTNCYMDPESFRKVGFMIGNMQIRSIYDCYFQNDKKELQKITLAYSMYDTVQQAYYMYGSSIQRKSVIDFGENYMDGMAESGFSSFAEGGFHLAQFKINYWGDDPNAEKVLFLKPTADLLPPPTDDFWIHGNTTFGDQPGAPNFVFPSTSNWQY